MRAGHRLLRLPTAVRTCVNCLKQAREFGLPQSGITMVALAAQTTDLHVMELENSQGLLMCLPFYWGLNERTRAFTQRVLPKTQPAYPSVIMPEPIDVCSTISRPPRKPSEPDICSDVTRQERQAAVATVAQRE
jgi:hypothetical protein